MSKYKGIDSREINCCDPSEMSIEAGISFDCDENQNILRFHFLEYIDTENGGKILNQTTKSMWLNRNNTAQLIASLQKLSF